MKKTLLISTLLFLLISSCDTPGEDEYNKSMRANINDLKKPCVVVAVKKRDSDAGFHGGYGSIIIKDANGLYVTFDGNSFDGEALVATYKAGDTIQ